MSASNTSLSKDCYNSNTYMLNTTMKVAGINVLKAVNRDKISI